MVVDLFHPEEVNAIFDRTGSTYCLRTAWHASSLERRESKTQHPPVTEKVRCWLRMDTFRGNTCENKQQAESTTEYIPGLIHFVVG
jgi:hypothetical protein